MCQNPSSIWLTATDLQRSILLVARADCGLWNCPECSHKNRNRWRWRIAVGSEHLLLNDTPVRFVTITSHERIRTLEAGIVIWRQAWKKLHGRIKTAAGFKPEYVMLPERHHSGALHMHMLIGADLKTRFWKDSGRKCGLGFMADSKPVDNVGKAAFYVTKYVTKSSKDTAWPEHFHRVRVSRGWPKPPEPEPTCNLLWEPVKTETELSERVRAARLDGLLVVNHTTGEIIERPFDKPDSSPLNILTSQST